MTKCNMKSISRSSDNEPPAVAQEAAVPDRSRTRSRNTYGGRRSDAHGRPGDYSRGHINTAAQNEAFAPNNQENGNNLFVFGNSGNTVQNQDKNKFSFTAPRKPPKPQPFQFGQPFQVTRQPPVVNNLSSLEKKSIYTNLNGPMTASTLPHTSSAATQMNMMTQSNIMNGFNPFVAPQQNTDSTQFGRQQQPSNFNNAGIQYNTNGSGVQFGAQQQQPVLNFNDSRFQFNAQSQQQRPNFNNNGVQCGMQSQQQQPNRGSAGLQFSVSQQQLSPNFNKSGIQFGPQQQQQGPNFNNSGIQYSNLNNPGMQFGTQPPPHQQQVSNLNNSCMQFGIQQQMQQTTHLNNTNTQYSFQPSNLSNGNTQFGMQQQQFSIQSQQPGTNFNAANLQFGVQQQQQMFQPGLQPGAQSQKSKNVLKSRATKSSAFNFSDMWKVPQQQPTFTPPPTQPGMQSSPPGFNQSNIQLPLILPPAAPTPQPTFGTPQPAPVQAQPAFGAPQPAFGAPQPAFGAPQPAFGTFAAPQPASVTSQPAFPAPQQAFGPPQPAPVTSQPAFGAPQTIAPGYNPRPNVPKTKSQRPQQVVKSTFGTGGAQPAQQSPVPGFNPAQIPPHATSLSLAQIQNLDLDTIINFRKSGEADFRESMIIFSKINPFASIPMVATKGKVAKPQLHNNHPVSTGNTPAMKEIYLQLPRSVVAATPLAKRIEFFKVSEREITFGADDGSKRKHAEHFRRRKPMRSIAGEGEEKLDSLPKRTKSRRREHVSKPMVLRKPRREDRCTSCHILLPKSSAFNQCDACYVSQSTQCDGIRQHSCGITLKREGYFTIPPLEDIPKLRRIDGQCIVKGFTIGRMGYGSVSYQDSINITNLNLDEIVHFDYREISLYPDESKKPPIGQGLNRRAQVTLDAIYPTGKGPYDVIRNIETIKMMNFEGTLRNMCKRNGTRFVDYRPETGSWIFIVEHFSKYKYKEELEVIKEKKEAKYKYKEEFKVIKEKKEARKKERIELIEREIRLNQIRLRRARLQKADELIEGFRENVFELCEKFSNKLKEVEDKLRNDL